VRIERIRVEGFGRLREVDTGAEPLDGLVVVLGPNEAGKSTLFTFLTTALYGFSPATRERNPHVPWGSDQAAGRVRLRLDGGGCAEVERRLRSTPSARLTVQGTTTEIHNRPVPWVEHVPRTVFRQVFAITLADLAAPDSETWARIQDNVVGSMGASDLRPIRSVADDLEREASEIWRPSRRGNQRLRDLQSEIRNARAARAAAYERDVRLRSLMDEATRIHARLAEAREERQRERLALERSQTLLPLKRRLDWIATLRAEGGDRAELAGLPPDPAERLTALEGELTVLGERRAALLAERAEREAVVSACDPAAERLVAERARVLDLVVAAAGLGAERARASELEAELDHSMKEERTVRAPVAAAGASGAARPGGGTRAPRAALAALALGTALTLWGIDGGGATALAVVGAVLAGVGLTLVVTSARERKAAAARSRTEADPLAPEAAERRRLAELERARLRRVEALEAARARIAEVERDAATLVAALGLSDRLAAEVARPEVLARTLDADLRRAERHQDAAMSAERDVRRLSREIATVDAAIGTLNPQLEELLELGRRLGGGSVAAGLARARDRLAAHRQADEAEVELERTHPDLGEQRLRLAQDDAISLVRLGDDEIARTRARIEHLEVEIERLVQRSEALSMETGQLRALDTVDTVDGAVASLKEAEATLVRERDRKWVLAKLLREADRRFREEHQPDLLRRASSYLSHLTGGRYDRLLVDESSGSHLFQVVGPGLPAPVALAAPVSTGTLEQAYLSLRFAIVDHLDRGGERLPIFVDEVFVNWDAERRVRGLEVLASLARPRQVFVFTCHPHVADELGREGASVILLGQGA
jgi:uncharacterized protein YhaN